MRSIGLLVAVGLALGACGSGEEAPDIRFGGEEVDAARQGWSPALSALVDSGNAAYRTGHYDEAARLFRRGTAEFPHQGAPWFGLYMAEHARGNVAAADSARERAQALTPSLPSAPVDSAADGTTPGDSAGVH